MKTVIIPDWLINLTEQIKSLLATSQIPTVPRFLISMKNATVIAQHSANLIDPSNVELSKQILDFANSLKPIDEPYIKEILLVFATKKEVHLEPFTPCNVLDGIGTRIHVVIFGAGTLLIGMNHKQFKQGTVFSISKDEQLLVHSLDLQLPTVQLVIACSADPRPVWKIFSNTNR